MNFDIVSRTEWGARSPRGTPRRMNTPTSRLFLHHTVGEYGGPDSPEPADGRAGMRRLQRDHFNRGFNDIGYSFVIDPIPLTAFVGRGPGIQGAHTKGYNSTSHAIAVVGNYQNLIPSDSLLKFIGELVAYGKMEGWWDDVITGGHRDVSATACPGSNLYGKIRTINQYAQGTVDKPKGGSEMNKGEWETLKQTKRATREILRAEIRKIRLEAGLKDNADSVEVHVNRILDGQYTIYNAIERINK